MIDRVDMPRGTASNSSGIAVGWPDHLKRQPCSVLEDAALPSQPLPSDIFRRGYFDTKDQG